MALRGIRVLELAGLAPVPFCGQVLQDFGASIIRIDKVASPFVDTLSRGKRSLALNLKTVEGIHIVEKLCLSSDVLLDPFRPGVMESLGLSPQILMKQNPRLIFARLSGFGQSGPLSKSAGHDINYLAISGVLSTLGNASMCPSPPINLLGDFAGGGLICAFGILAALVERQTSGCGQVIDSSITEGSSYVSSFLWQSRSMPGIWGRERGANVLDGGAHFYNTYRTKDDLYIAVGAIEPQFYSRFLQGLSVSEDDYPQMDVSQWSTFYDRIALIIAKKTRQEWMDVYSRLDACVTPVLSLDEAAHYPHNVDRKAFSNAAFPNPAPRLSRTPATAEFQLPRVGEHSVEILSEIGFAKNRINEMVSNGTVGVSTSPKSSL